MTGPCVVFGCRNKGNHRFPKDQLRRSQWMNAVKYIKHNLGINKHSLICSSHFRRSDFSLTPSFWYNYHTAKRVLKKTATPSVFAWSKVSPEPPPPTTKDNVDAIGFDPDKVHATYSRIQPIAFAEEHLCTVPEAAENDDEDPLQCSDQESDISLEEIQSTNYFVSTGDKTESSIEPVGTMFFFLNRK